MRGQKSNLTLNFFVGFLIWSGCQFNELLANPSTTGQSKSDLVLVDNGKSMVPIVIPADSAPCVSEAVADLAGYIDKISGSKVKIIKGTPRVLPDHAIWIGHQPVMEELFPDVDLKLKYPEEILLVNNGKHILISGRDVIKGGEQVEFGTLNAIYTFIEKHLGVRWLWPGDLGEDYVKTKTIAIPAFNYRFHPVFRQRKFWPESNKTWLKRQRILSTYCSLHAKGSHAFTKWWDQYNEKHPDYFALQPDGTRPPHPSEKYVKICVSNPNVQKQWLANAEEDLKKNPSKIMVSASPNDASSVGVCSCENCRAWDNPNGKTMLFYGRGKTEKRVATTDRQVKFWNILAQGLKKKFPNREVYVGAYAYGPYKAPPIAEKPSSGIAVGYVGHFPFACQEFRKQDQKNWRDWAQKASAMWYRPNLFHYSGGWLALPTLGMRRTIEDFRFLAENKCIGIEVDTLPLSWATQGVQYYVMAQMTYNPFQDGEAMLKDYYRRGFGRAADEIEAYSELMENAHYAVLEKIKLSGAFARKAIDVFKEIYTDELLEKATKILDKAARETAGDTEKYQQRVAFIRLGFDYVENQIKIMRLMTKVRESKGADKEAVKQALALCRKREILSKKQPYAFRRADWYHNSRKLDDFMGPPSKSLLTGLTPEELKEEEYRGMD